MNAITQMKALAEVENRRARKCWDDRQSLSGSNRDRQQRRLAQTERAARMHRDGMDLEGIAHTLDVSVSTVRRYLWQAKGPQ